MTPELKALIKGMREAGAAVAIWSREELRGADPKLVQDRAIAEGNETIDALVGAEEDDSE